MVFHHFNAAAATMVTPMESEVNAFRIDLTETSPPSTSLMLHIDGDNRQIELEMTNQRNGCFQLCHHSDDFRVKVLILAKTPDNSTLCYLWRTGNCEQISFGCTTFLAQFYVRIAESGEKLVVPKLTSYSDAMHSMLNHEHLADFQIRVKNETFKASKCILSAHSKYFEQLLKDDTVDECEFDDIDPMLFYEVLMFMYIGEAETDDIENLFLLADFLQMDGLRLYCEKLLLSHITESNFGRIVSMAVTHHASENFPKLAKDHLQTNVLWDFVEKKF